VILKFEVGSGMNYGFVKAHLTVESIAVDRDIFR
jgi:hypothetical protein